MDRIHTGEIEMRGTDIRGSTPSGRLEWCRNPTPA